MGALFFYQILFYARSSILLRLRVYIYIKINGSIIMADCSNHLNNTSISILKCMIVFSHNNGRSFFYFFP